MRKTRGNFSLIIQVFAVFCLGYSSSLSIIGNSDRNSVKNVAFPDKGVCETKECVLTAATILRNMDPEVDPCDNFYKFACGGYINSTDIPEYKSSVSEFSTVSDKLKDQLKRSIEANLTENDPKSFKLLQDFYYICMNESQIENSSEKDFMGIMTDLGGWPVLLDDKWDESTFSWQDNAIDALQKGYWSNEFIRVGISIDKKNNTKRIVSLDQASLGLNQKYLSKGLQDKIVSAYYDFMVDVAVMLGANNETARKELLDSLIFEIALANISLPSEKRRDSEKLYNMMDPRTVRERYPNTPWIEYIDRVLSPHAKLGENERINVAVPSYLSDLEKLLAVTPKRTQANYAMWRVTYDSVSMLGKRFRDRTAEFAKVISGTSVQPPRWKTCISGAMGAFNLAGSSMYVRNYFDRSAKKSAQDLLVNVQQSFKELLQENEWMDEKTKNSALEKLNHVIPYIGYPDELLDDKKLEDYYKNVSLDKNSYVNSSLLNAKFHINRTLKRFREPVNKTEWITHAGSAVVNAFYRPSENSIQFPAGILQGMFFGNDRPKYMNFGAIGWIMGHEMTHGFDDQGKQYDQEGNLVNWWEGETNEAYLKRAQCIIDQYGNYTSEEVGLNLNGINTQGENIADNGGLKEAYYAYNDWEGMNGVEMRLPGLEFTSQQMFWLSAANIWCSVSRPERTKVSIITGVHSPHEFRVIGPMSNMKEFARDFHCPVGSKMNPTKKCAVW